MSESNVKKTQALLDEKEGLESSISRRALIAGTAAFAVGASASQAMAGDHPKHSHHHDAGGDNTGLVRASGDCQIAGEICQAHCQTMLATGDNSLAACAASVRDMMASCSSLMQMAASNSKHLPAMAKLCSQILKECKDECEKHPEHAECKACAQACDVCLKECKKVMS